MFRQKALDAQHAGGLGEIVLIRPVSFTFLTLLAAAMALLVVGFFLFGSYTKRSTVSGQLVPPAARSRCTRRRPASCCASSSRKARRYDAASA